MVSQKIKKVYAKLIRDMEDPVCVWEYNDKRANHAVDFVQKYCKHSKGKMGGKPFILEIWERAAVAATFGFIHKIDGTRRFLEVVLIVARKNGKSTLAAAIGLYLMIADQEPGAEVYAVATKKDQAKVIWLEAKRMVKKSPSLRRKIKTLVAEMNSGFNDSVFRPLGSDSDTQDGLNVHGATLDEIHAWKDKNLYDVIVDGAIAREQPLIFVVTTAGTVREGIYDIKYDEIERVIDGYTESGDAYENDRLLPLVYELDKRSEWAEPENWMKANPGLGTIKNRPQLVAKVNKAKANPLLVKNLLCKDFNVRETAGEAFLAFEQLYNPAEFDLAELSPRPRYGIGGADLSENTDLTAAAVIFKTAVNSPFLYVLCMFWLPEDLLEKRTREDKIPYDIWHSMELLRTTPGNQVHPKFVTEWFLEVQNEMDIYLPWIGYDGWSAKYWVDDMRNNFGQMCVEPVIQGKKTLSAPMKTLAAELDAKHIVYNNHPILKWCMSNVAVDVDKNMNIQPCKTKNQRRRIDGFAALLDAYVIYQNHMEDYNSMI